MKITRLFASLLAFCSVGTPSFAQTEVNLWPGGAPGSVAVSNSESGQNTAYVEETFFRNNNPDMPRLRKVVDPTLTIYTPDAQRANRMAVVICPGGGYMHLAIKEEGHDVAKRLASMGYVAAVLKYRLPSSQIMEQPHLGPLADAQRAIRVMRGRAAEFGIDKVGIMGFSAGGHLAASASTLFDVAAYDALQMGDAQLSARPDFSVLCYPVISLRPELTHGTTRRCLIGEPPADINLVHRFSADENVNANTPPAFIFHSADDNGVTCLNSVRYAEAMRSAGRRFELHIFSTGGHGVGLAQKLRSKEWPTLLDTWLRETFAE